MPSCRSCFKDGNESISSCVKSRNPLGVIVLVLLIVSSAFIYTAYYINSINSHKPTLQPVPQAFSNFITKLSAVGWCLSNISTPSQNSSHGVRVANQSVEGESQKTTSACLQLVVVIPGDFYPAFKNRSIYKGSITRSLLFPSESDEILPITYYIQHNLSTSTKHSRDVLVPAYVNITSTEQLPSYIRDASTCHMLTTGYKPTQTGTVSSCTQHITPKFHVDQKWEHNLDIYVSMDEGRMNIHLMYTSYFLLISAVSVIAFTVIRNRNASKNINKNKLPQKMPIVVY